MEGNILCLIFNTCATRQEASRLLQYALPALTAVVLLPIPHLILFLVETFPTPQTARTHVRTRSDRAVAAQCGGLRRGGAHRSVFVVTTSPPTDASPPMARPRADASRGPLWRTQAIGHEKNAANLSPVPPLFALRRFLLQGGRKMLSLEHLGLQRPRPR